MKKYIRKIINILKENKNTVLTLFVSCLLADIFLLDMSSDFIIFGVLIMYVISINAFRLNSKQTFLLCLGLLGIMFISYLFSGTSVSTEKAAVWLVLFLGIGVIQQWKE